MYTDKTMACRDCNMDFVFTSGEQEFHASKGFTNAPSRCPECRAKRKSSMGYDGGGGGRSFGGGSREMHTAVCSSCGGEARVPFVPRGDKPVYCSDCFQNQRSSRW